MKTKLLIISGLALHFSIVQGQVEVGMGAGISVYHGEIGAPSSASNYLNGKLLQGNLSTQGFTKVEIFPGIKLRGNIGYTEYNAHDEYSKDAGVQLRNLTLTGIIVDAGMMVEYYPLPRIPFFLTTGMKYSKVGYSIKNSLGELVTSSNAMNASSRSIPMGLGVDLISKKMGPAVSIELITNKVNSTILDGMKNLNSRNSDYYSSITINCRVPLMDGKPKIKSSKPSKRGYHRSLTRNNSVRRRPKHSSNSCPSF